MLKISLRSFAVFPALLLLSSTELCAQSNLTLSSGMAQPGGAVSLNLSLSSTGSSPAALQWTFTYPNTISSLNVSAGPVLSSAGKAVTCAGNSGAYICVASGMNGNSIANGIAATVTATLSGSNSATIGIINGLGASPTGIAIPLTATGGVVSAATPTVTVSTISCSPTTLIPGGTSTCSVAISATSGATVALTSSSPNLTLPASVTVPAGANSATFIATAGQFSTNQTPTITAALGGVSQTTTLNLVSQPVVSTLQCAAASLTANGNTTCTVTLSKPALAGGANVILSSTTGLLGLPSSILVPANANFATFSATTANLSSSQSATITGTFNGSSASFNLSLVAPVPQLVSMSCASSNLSAGGSSTCTVNLSASSSGGSSVSLNSNNAYATVPAGLTIASGAISASFSVVAGSAFTTNQTAIITASLNGAQITTSINLIAPTEPALISSLACSPTSLGPNASTNCTVTLTKAAPAGGILVALSNNNSALTSPTSIMVNAGATTAVFIASTGALSTDQNATLTATVGTSSASAVISLGAPVLVSSLSCSPTGLGPNASTNCTVTLTKAAPAGGILVALSNNNSALTSPTSIMVNAGATTAVFIASTGALSADQSATLTATVGTSSTSAVISLGAAALVSSLSCSPTSLGPNASTNCTVTLTKAAPAGGILVGLSNNNSALITPVSVTANAGATTAVFTATTATLSSDQNATLTATVGSSSASAVISLAAAAVVSSLSCSPASLGANASANCTVTLTKPAPAGGTQVSVSNTNSALTAPTSVTVNAGALTAVFVASTATLSTDQNATLTATVGSSSANAVIALAAAAQVSSLSCSPASLLSNASTSCAVTLTKAAPAGGTVVTISNTNNALTAPTSVTVNAGATTAMFTASTATLLTDQNATLSANVGASSVNAIISLGTSIQVSSLSCNLASLAPNASTSCTIVLTKAAPASGISITLASSTTALTVPPSVIVSAAATSTSFTVTAGAIRSDQIATITATYGSAMVNADLSLLAPALISSISCNPPSLGSGGSSICTVMLSKNAPSGGAAVVVSTVNGLLTSPSSLTIAAGSSSGSFSLQAGSFTTTQDGSATVAYNGSSATTAVHLLASATVLSSVTCSSKTMTSGATTVCALVLSQPAPANTTVTISSNSPSVTVPGSISVAAGSSTQNFNATAGIITADATAVITAFLGASSQSTSISLSSLAALSSLTCTPTNLIVGGSASCTVTLSKATTGVFITLASNNSALAVPSGIAVPQGSTSAVFTVAAQSATSGSVALSASYNGSAKEAVLTILASNTTDGLGRLVCHPNTLQRGNRGQCRLTLRQVGNLPGSDIQLRSSSDSIRLPSRLRTRAGQSSVEFQVEAAADAVDPVVVEAQLGNDVVQDTIAVTPDRSKRLHVPGSQYVKFGNELRFTVSASDPSASLSTGPLPPGAYFDAGRAEFHWTPDASQLGVHDIQFKTGASGGATETATVNIKVETGEPIITGIINAASRSSELACSPGAIAAVQGRWFTADPSAFDASGASLQLAGARVLVNGIVTPILAATEGELSFLCPQEMPGSSLQIEVQTGQGISAPASTVSQAAAPGIFSAEAAGGSQGAVLLDGSGGFAVVRNHRVAGQPALPGEHVTVYATGLEGMTNVVVQIGNVIVASDFIMPVPNRPGLFQVAITTPDGLGDGETSALLIGEVLGGLSVKSNAVSMAIEGASNSASPK